MFFCESFICRFLNMSYSIPIKKKEEVYASQTYYSFFDGKPAVRTRA